MSTKKLQIIGSLGGGASVELDSTLTQSGKAADAKAVGDALLEAANNTHEHSNKEVLDQISSTVDIYTDATAPVDADEGSIWIDAGSSTDGPSIYVRKNGTWAMSSDGKAQKQSDWNEVDGASAAYIRNKPFGYMEDVFANSNMPFTLFQNSVYSGSISYDIFDGVVTGDEITVVWDGTPYNVTAKQIVVNIGGVTTMTVSNAMGNAKIAADTWANSSDDDSGEPFIILPGVSRIFTKSTLATHSVIVKFKDNVVKINPKFLPDEVATHEYVQEQIEAIPDVDLSGLATVEYVDEQISAVGGMQGQVQADWDETDTTSPAYIKNKPQIPSDSGASVQVNWNQTDSAQPDYIKNKPFYEENGVVHKLDTKFLLDVVSDSVAEKLIFPETTITGFSQNSSGLYVKGFPAQFTLQVGNTYKVIWEDVEYTLKAFSSDLLTPGAASVVLGNEGMFTGASTTPTEPFSVAYIPLNNYNTFLTLDGDAADVSIYEVANSGGVTVILPETRLGGFTQDNTGMYQVYFNPAICELTPGNEYRVIWDGEEYTVTAIDISFFLPGYVLAGNGADVGLPGNGEPFAVAYYSNPDMLYTESVFYAVRDWDKSHTIAIYRDEAEAPKVVQYLDGNLTAVPVEQSAVATYVEKRMEEVIGNSLPTVTASDAGKFLRVSSEGLWVVEAIPFAEEATF